MPLTDAQKQNLEVKVYGTLAAGGGQAQDTLNVLHYRRTTFANPYDASAFLTQFQTQVQASWLAAVSAKWTLVKIGVRVIDSPIEAETPLAVGVVGGVAGDCEPGHVAMLISKKTALRGRSYQGRMYVCGVPESGNVDNALTGAHKALLDTLATALLGTVVTTPANQYVPQIVSTKYSALTVEPAVVLGTPIIGMVAKQIVSRMDSRASKPTS